MNRLAAPTRRALLLSSALAPLPAPLRAAGRPAAPTAPPAAWGVRMTRASRRGKFVLLTVERPADAPPGASVALRFGGIPDAGLREGREAAMRRACYPGSGASWHPEGPAGGRLRFDGPEAPNGLVAAFFPRPGAGPAGDADMTATLSAPSHGRLGAAAAACRIADDHAAMRMADLVAGREYAVGPGGVAASPASATVPLRGDLSAVRPGDVARHPALAPGAEVVSVGPASVTVAPGAVAAIPAGARLTLRPAGYWLDPDDDAAVEAADGAVAALRCKVTGIALSQPDPARRPALVALPGGARALRFDQSAGPGRRLGSAPGANALTRFLARGGRPFTLFRAVRIAAEAAGDGRSHLSWGNGGAGPLDARQFRQRGGPSGPAFNWQVGYGDALSSFDTATADAAGRWAIFEALFDGRSAEIRVNGFREERATHALTADWSSGDTLSLASVAGLRPGMELVREHPRLGYHHAILSVDAAARTVRLRLGAPPVPVLAGTPMAFESPVALLTPPPDWPADRLTLGARNDREDRSRCFWGEVAVDFAVARILSPRHRRGVRREIARRLGIEADLAPDPAEFDLSAWRTHLFEGFPDGRAWPDGEGDGFSMIHNGDSSLYAAAGRFAGTEPFARLPDAAPFGGHGGLSIAVRPLRPGALLDAFRAAGGRGAPLFESGLVTTAGRYLQAGGAWMSIVALPADPPPGHVPAAWSCCPAWPGEKDAPELFSDSPSAYSAAGHYRLSKAVFSWEQPGMKWESIKRRLTHDKRGEPTVNVVAETRDAVVHYEDFEEVARFRPQWSDRGSEHFILSVGSAVPPPGNWLGTADPADARYPAVFPFLALAGLRPAVAMPPLAAGDDPALAAILAAMGTPPSAAYQARINDLVRRLRARRLWEGGSAWDGLCFLFDHAAEARGQALVNWRAPGTPARESRAAGAPAWAPGRGFAGGGAGAFDVPGGRRGLDSGVDLSALRGNPASPAEFAMLAAVPRRARGPAGDTFAGTAMEAGDALSLGFAPGGALRARMASGVPVTARLHPPPPPAPATDGWPDGGAVVVAVRYVFMVAAYADGRHARDMPVLPGTAALRDRFPAESVKLATGPGAVALSAVAKGLRDEDVLYVTRALSEHLAGAGALAG